MKVMFRSKLKNFHLVLRDQLPPTLKLATPVIISQLGQMTMGVVDTLMVGRLGPQYIGGVGVGAAIFAALSVFGMGLTLGLDFLVSHAFGRRKLDECGYWLIQSMFLTLTVAIPLTLLGFFLSFHLGKFGITSEVIPHAERFLRLFIWSLVPFLFYFCFRTYLQAMNRVKVVTAMVIAGNFMNALLDWVFIYGHFGLKPMYAAGPGLATFITRIVLLCAIIAYTFWRNATEGWGLRNISWTFEKTAFFRLIELGLPAGLQYFFEVTIFALSTILAAHLSSISLAAHSIVLNIASLTFMIPLGLGSATSVRVGQFIGQKNFDKARHSGWTSLFVGTVFMSGSGLTFYFLNRPILFFFTQNTEVLQIGKRLLFVAAFFQIADGLQTVGTGALRGLGNTRSAMNANLIGHWVFGLPVGYTLCFYSTLGIVGLWIGLTTGLCIVAFLILRSWITQTRKLSGH